MGKSGLATVPSVLIWRPAAPWLTDTAGQGKMAVMLLVDRQRGTLFGLAVADALGAAVEFEMPGTFPEVTGYRGGGPHGLAPGEWTDDSSMSLALADSMASVGWDLDDQGRRSTPMTKSEIVCIGCR